MYSRTTLRRLSWLRHHRCGALLAALFLFILADPAFARSTISVAFLLLGVVAIVALALLPFRPILFTTWTGLLLLMIAAETLVSMHMGGRWLGAIALASTAVFTAIVIVELLRYVMDAHPISADKVFAAVSAYVLLAVMFATLFSLLQLNQTQAFHVNTVNEPDGKLGWSALMYFSFTVLTSTGFGEITPTTHQARSLIVIEQVLGVMYVAFLIARLANLYGERRRT
ncbi:MAG: potassium channel family protein [Reyranellaceae bacterium]